MTNRQIAKVAQEVIESKLGFKETLNNIVLLESGDDGKTVTSVSFRRRYFNDIEYVARFNKTTYTYELTIINIKTDEELYIF